MKLKVDERRRRGPDARRREAVRQEKSSSVRPRMHMQVAIDAKIPLTFVGK